MLRGTLIFLINRATYLFIFWNPQNNVYFPGQQATWLECSQHLSNLFKKALLRVLLVSSTCRFLWGFGKLFRAFTSTLALLGYLSIRLAFVIDEVIKLSWRKEKQLILPFRYLFFILIKKFMENIFYALHKFE